MSTSLYTTFGNELEYRITNATLEAYLENATIKFPLPEASSTILSELADLGSINPVELDAVRSKLVSIGFGKPSATAMASVLIALAKSEGTDPMVYFDLNEQSLKLAVDSYRTINMMRPPGNRIGLTTPKNNLRTSAGPLIQP
jgi:hypothetical protein